MTAHLQNISRELLAVLSDRSPGVLAEAVLHKELMSRVHPPPSLSDFTIALQHCDAQKFVIGTPGKFDGAMRWQITDAGELARRQL